MRSVVVYSTNNNPDYLFYVPLVTWVWRQLGWECACLITHDVGVNRPAFNYITPDFLCRIPNIERVRTGTLAQVARHFACHYFSDDDYLLLTDIDMIPLCDFIKPDYDKKTVWGWDLTGYGFIPVSYIGMKARYWRDLMGCFGTIGQDMERSMKENGRAYKDKWEDYWDADWDILTQKVIPRKDEFTFIDRGFVHLAKDATARGRVDRYDWDKTRHQTPLIDAHCDNVNPSHPYKWNQLRDILFRKFGCLPLGLDDYTKEHHKHYGR